MRALIREVSDRGDNAGTLAAILIGGIAFTIAAHDLWPRPWLRHGFSTKGDIAAATVKKYAYEAYPSWRQRHDGCPSHLIVLNEYMNNKDVRDPWGHDYEMFCGCAGIVVRSFGEDGRRDTGDDVWSH